jgi:hypothetical protein
MKRRLLVAITGLAMACSALVPATASTAGPSAAVALPQGTKLRSLEVIKSSNLTGRADGVLVASLQGLVAKSSPDQIFIDEGGPGAAWLNDLQTTYGITVDNSAGTSADLVRRFKKYVRGYLLYDYAANPQSVNVATSLSGPLHALPVDRSQVAQVRALGITSELMDVSGKTEKWAYSNYKSLFSTTIAAELNPEISYHLRDYATLTNAFTFYDGVTSWRRKVLSDLAPGATLMGYGNSESDMIKQASEQGVTSIPSDVAPNLAALSSVRGVDLQQKPQPSVPTQKKHYVSFVISDGDNVAYNLWSMREYRDSPDRGFSDVGYGISPSLADLAPSAMASYYRDALRGATAEDFIAGPSGTGYTYPSRMPPADLDRYVTRMNSYLGRADLGIVEILEDQNVFDRGSLWTKFLSQPNTDALFYFGPDAHGGINWYDGKPVVAQRDVLWQGLTEEQQLIDNINSRPADPSSADGYTLVLVHCWTKNLTAVKTVVEGLDPDVEVVTPTELVQLIKENKAR